VTSGSGSDPHLLALLRALRLRLAAPEAAAAGAADTAAALSDQASDGTNGGQYRGFPGRPAGVERTALPPGRERPGLPAATPPPELPAEPYRPANPDPFARSPGGDAVREPAPPVHPAGLISSFRAGAPGPAEPAGSATPQTPPAPGPLPSWRPYLPAVRSADPADPGVTAEPPGAPGAATHPGAGNSPPAPGTATPGRPAWTTPPASAPGPASINPGVLVPPNPCPHTTSGPGAPPAYPMHGGVLSGGPISVDAVPGLSAVGRAVPGQYPEPPNLGTALPGVPRVGPIPAPHGPGAVPPTDGMDPADDAALREVRRLLGNSLSLAGGPDDVATRLRAALMLAQPELMAMLPGSPQTQREQLAQALTWLVHHLDQPPALVAGCVNLGAALAECGVQPAQPQLIGAALAEAMRAGMSANGWRQDFDQAWRTTWQHVHEWIAHGEALARFQPTTWRAVVVSHERRRPDLAVVRFRPYLPMRFRPGQYARIEVPGLPGVWRPYSLAGAPRRDNLVELHVRAKTESGVSGALVHRTAVGDEVRFGRAEGAMGLPGQGPARDLLLVAGDTGVAPLKAMLTELAATGDPRSAVLFWGVRDLGELYDIEEIAAIARACRRATVVPVVSEGEAGPYASGLVTDAIAAYGEWSGAEVFLAGPPLMLAATSAALQLLGVSPQRIHHDAPEE